MSTFYMEAEIELVVSLPEGMGASDRAMILEEPDWMPSYTLFLGADGEEMGQSLPMSRKFVDGEMTASVEGETLNLKFTGTLKIPTSDEIAKDVFKPAVKSKEGIHVNAVSYNNWMLTVKSETVSMATLATKKPSGANFPR